MTTALRFTVTVTSSEAKVHGPAPSGSFVVTRNVTVAPTSEGSTVYVAVAFAPAIVVGDKVPLPETIVHVADVALPPSVAFNGIVAGSQTEKSGPADTAATGLTVTVTFTGAPLHPFADGVIV